MRREGGILRPRSLDDPFGKTLVKQKETLTQKRDGAKERKEEEEAAEEKEEEEEEENAKKDREIRKVPRSTQIRGNEMCL